jgi:cytochrome c553
MTPMSKPPLLLLLFICGITAAQAQTGDAAAGAQKAWLCSGCHGVPGWRNAYPVYHVPRLGGQHAEYLVAALKEYKEKQRAHSTMQAIAAGLSEQDMADLAAFFSGTAPEPNQ